MQRAVYLFLIIFLFISSCKKDPVENPPTGDLTQIENTLGFNVLHKMKGIWSGPVSSTTALGNFPTWVVDFRPIAENQLSAKNELDTLNDIFMSFFVAKYNGEYRIAFRNGGSFAGMKRVSYFLCDSVMENNSGAYYRFSEIKKGTDRAYTEVIFRGDSVYLNSFTNKTNTQSTSTPHMSWTAIKKDDSSYAAALSLFNFPKKTLRKDLSASFENVQESIFYGMNGTPSGDPYPEEDQPYLGQATISYSYASSYSPQANKKVFLMLTTQALIEGFTLNTAALATQSRYVILAANDLSFIFNYMHPGTYFLYALYDADDNGVLSSGDWLSPNNTSFTLASEGNTSASTQISFTLP